MKDNKQPELPVIRPPSEHCSLLVRLAGGCRENRQNHIRDTAALINRSSPDFVRVRRLWLYGRDGDKKTRCPLYEQIDAGDFVPQTPEGTVRELRDLVARLDPLATFFTCDHQNNYAHVSGVLAEDRQEMLAEIDDFLALPLPERQAHYQLVGSRI